jgi:hypothetical protein
MNPITIGETAVLGGRDSGNGNLVLVQDTTSNILVVGFIRAIPKSAEAVQARHDSSNNRERHAG